MKNLRHKDEWVAQDIKSLTSDFINYVDDFYYKQYKSESEYFEKINNRLFLTITILGFLVILLIGIKGILAGYISNATEIIFTVLSFIIPSISSIILLYLNQKGFKEKEIIREEGRIQSKFLINEAKARFAVANNDKDFENIYQWLNNKIKTLQENQSKVYFTSHNKFEKS